MPPTVADLLELPGLGLNVVAGRAGLDRSVRWVHSSELPDPTRWLRGGELLLTTGLGLKGSPNVQRAYVNRLVKADLAGLGFGLGFGFDAVPGPVLRAADRAGFPVLEVPYPVPFIAIGEAVSSAVAEERMRELELSEEIHDRLARLAGAGSGPGDVLDEVVALTGGWIYLYDTKGSLVAAAGASSKDAPDPRELWATLPPGLLEGPGVTSAFVGPSGSVLALPVDAGKRHEGVVAFGRRGRLDVRDRVAVRHAVSLLGLLLASRRAVAEVERRVAGDLLVEAIEGHVSGDLLVRRLELAGFAPGAPAAVMVLRPAGPAPPTAEEMLALVQPALDSAAERARSAVVEGDAVALVAHGDPHTVATVALEAARAGRAEDVVRIGVGDVVDLRDVRRSYLTATLALRAAPSTLALATTKDLGAYGLMLGHQSRPVLESFVHSVLGSILERDGERDSELFASVRAFVESGGRWEEGAQALGVHRHTLRYRINQAQELLDRDLFSAEDRMEIWLACKALDLLQHDDA